MTAKTSDPGFIKLLLITAAEFDARFGGEGNLPDGLLAFLIDDALREPQITFNGRRHPLLQRGPWDRTVDGAFAERFSSTIPTIQEGIIDPTVTSIMVINAGDTATVNWPAGGTVRRILGKDADTTLMPQNVVMGVTDSTLDEVRFDTTSLTMAGQRMFGRDLLFSGTGQCVHGAGGAFSALMRSRFIGLTSSAPGLAITGGLAFLIQQPFFIANSDNFIPIDVQVAFTQLVVQGGFFLDPPAGVLQQFRAAASGTGLTQSKFTDNVYFVGSGGGMSITGSQNALRSNDYIVTQTNPGAACVHLIPPAGTNVNTKMTDNTFIASGPPWSADNGGYNGGAGLNNDIMFNYALSAGGTDDDMTGLSFRGNDAPNGGIFGGAKNMRWTDNDLRNCVIDFNDKPGQIVTGGDMTGATLVNIPADIVFRGVKGQNDRGNTGPSLFRSGSPIVVVAINAGADLIDIADYEASGADDDVEIQAAIDDL